MTVYELVIREPYPEPLPRVGDLLIVTSEMVWPGCEDERVAGYRWKGITTLTLEPAQRSCGHPVSAIRYDGGACGRDTTNWCSMCVAEAETEK